MPAIVFPAELPTSIQCLQIASFFFFHPRRECSVLPAREDLFAQGRAQSTCALLVAPEAEFAISGWSSSERSWPGSQRCTALGGHSHSLTNGSENADLKIKVTEIS